MPSVEVKNMRVALFVEVHGETYLATIPHERMQMLVQLAASLCDDGKLSLSPTGLFDFAATGSNS